MPDAIRWFKCKLKPPYSIRNQKRVFNISESDLTFSCSFLKCLSLPTTKFWVMGYLQNLQISHAWFVLMICLLADMMSLAVGSRGLVGSVVVGFLAMSTMTSAGAFVSCCSSIFNLHLFHLKTTKRMFKIAPIPLAWFDLPCDLFNFRKISDLFFQIISEKYSHQGDWCGAAVLDSYSGCTV